MKKVYIILLFPVFLMACSSATNLTKLTEDGYASYRTGDYVTALLAWDQVIANYETKGDPLQCPLYGDAGQAALNLNDETKGIDYLEKDTYTPFVSAETYSTLGYYYQSIDNLSKELDALDALYTDFPEERVKFHTTQRLFDAASRSENWELVLDLWPQLSDLHRSQQSYLSSYLEMALALENDTISDTISNEILKLDPDDIMALGYEARKYYNRAENRYQAEMSAYEKNKTNAQYKKLLKALDEVTADFKTSRKYFLKLYELQPDPNYATYLSNIFARLDDKKKAEYYKSLADQ